MSNTQYDVQNGDIPPELLDSDSDRQVSAGRNTHQDNPNFQRAYDLDNPQDRAIYEAAKREERANKPSFWQRLFGKNNRSNNQSDTDTKTPTNNQPKKPSWWKRHMPTWLGGMSKQELASYDHAHEELFQNVTAKDLENMGFSAEKIAQIRSVVHQTREQASASGFLREHGEIINLSAKDLGISNQEIQMIYSRINNQNMG